MNIMDSDNNSRLDCHKRRILTCESQAGSRQLQRLLLSKCTEPLVKGDRLISFISNTCVTKSNHSFQLPQMAHSKDNRIFKSSAVKAPFSKHRKKMNYAHNDKRESMSTSKLSNLPTGFSRILKAKSTVIRQNKLQEFYINLGDEEPNQKIMNLQAENTKSNFFKPNFGKKRTKAKRQSVYFEKSVKTPECCIIERVNMSKKTEQFDAKNTIEQDSILKERFTMNNRRKAINHKKIHRNLSDLQKDKINSQLAEKQNMEFNLQPWDNHEDDAYF